MENKHTKGQWINNENLFIEDSEGTTIAQVYKLRKHGTVSIQQTEYNAKLITAAPALLNSALLDNLFPMINEKQKKEGWDFAKSIGWKMDEPIEIFAMRFRNNAIKSATE